MSKKFWRMTECVIYSFYTVLESKIQRFRDVFIETIRVWKETLPVRYETENIVFEACFCEQEYNDRGVLVYMEYIYGDEPEKAAACVTVLHVPSDAKVKEVFEFELFWIGGKWEIIKFFGYNKELRAQGISDDAIDFLVIQAVCSIIPCLSRTDVETDLTSGFSSLDWIEHA